MNEVHLIAYLLSIYSASAGNMKEVSNENDRMCS